MKSTYDLKDIANSGGSLELDASKYSTYDLKEIARSLNDGSKLYLRNLDEKSTYDLKDIAKAKKTAVIFYL